MEENKRYIIKLIGGNLIGTGSFLAINENRDVFFSNDFFVNDNIEHFEALESDSVAKWAVIIDEMGTGRWENRLFRNIEFISSDKFFCELYIQFKIQEFDLRYSKMDLFEELLKTIESGDSSLHEIELNNQISQIGLELKKVKRQLEQLSIRS